MLVLYSFFYYICTILIGKCWKSFVGVFVVVIPFWERLNIIFVLFMYTSFHFIAQSSKFHEIADVTIKVSFGEQIQHLSSACRKMQNNVKNKNFTHFTTQQYAECFCCK